MGGWSIFLLEFSKYPFFGVPNGWVVHFFLWIQLVPIFWVPNLPNGWYPIIFSKFQLVPGTKRGGPLWFFQNFSWYRVPKGVVPSDFFQISVGTRYQNGWVVHCFLEIQLVPNFGYGLEPNILTPPWSYKYVNLRIR